MRRRSQLRAVRWCRAGVLHGGLLLVLLGLSGGARGEPYEVEVEQPARLGIWLGERWSRLHAAPAAGAPELYLPGLQWRVPEERVEQFRQKTALLRWLRNDALSPEVAEADANALVAFVESLPVTGRVILEKSDPRWLEVHPQQDPLLRPGQRIVVPERPATVTVLWGDGRLCRVRHAATAHALDYVRSCAPGADPATAWIVQPEGRVQRRGIAEWNQEAQDTPAPGAWIVVDDARLPWHETVYEQLARLLATQGPAPDSGAEAPLSAPEVPTGLMDRLQTRDRPRDPLTSASDWGSVGLLQMPSARMMPEGDGGFGFSHAWPYTKLNFTLQPFDWLETSFRYLDINNRLYNPNPALSGDQTFKDKSIDVKLRLSQESRWLPQTAVGIRDLTGTGKFSGEYVAASKRFGNFDWTLGLGWGYLGARGNLPNPLSWLSPKFDTRPTETESAGTGGNINLGSYFRGPTALFAGLEYQTPWDPLILKLEYEGNDYQHEPIIHKQPPNNQEVRWPLNIGAVWRYSPNLDITLGVERGTTALVGMHVHGRLNQLAMPKLHDPASAPVSRAYPVSPADWQATAAALEEATGWQVLEIRRGEGEISVLFEEVSATYWHGYLDRIAAILHRDAPAEAKLFRVRTREYGFVLREYLVDRVAWVDAKTRPTLAHEKKPVSRVVRASVPGSLDSFVNPDEAPLFAEDYRPFSTELGMYYQQNLGGPDGFLLYQTGAQFSAGWRPRADTWLFANVRGRMVDNYDRFKYTAPSNLPRVRTYLREFATTSYVTLPLFQLTHAGRLSDNQFYSVYGGLLESMFGGVGAEWLYRPWNSRVAFGVDVNAVRQRGFAQDFSFRDYQVATGHATLYLDTGIKDIQALLSFGRYLAGDVGVTVSMSRVFDNGVSMGAWFTKTNVSAQEFGEGSFDKGIYIGIPYDAFLPRSGGSVANLVFQPLIRDGGAKLSRSFALEPMTYAWRGDSLRWRAAADTRETQFGDVGDNYDAPARLQVSAFDAAFDDLNGLAERPARLDFWKSLFYASGATLASAALDKPLDELAKDYGDTTPMKGVELVGNLLPFAALGVSGVAALAKQDDPILSKASFASLEAGGVGLAAALGMKFAIGRVRPEKNQGPGQFTPFSTANGDSSFPSVHSTVAWAALTPYAQAYDAPWLYGLAAVTNLARIGERKHWLSDTVAGAFLGYGLGSLFWESRKRERTPYLLLRPGEVGLVWETP